MSRLSLLLLIVLLLVSLTSVSSAQTGWQQVIDKEAGFTISFLGKPIYIAETDPATGLQIEIYKFFYTGRLLRITFAPLSGSVRTPSELSRVYSEFANQVVPQNGTLLRQQKLADGGRQYDTLAETKDGTIYGRTRFYLHNGRYYTIAFEMFARDGINERKQSNFSLRLIFLMNSLPG